MSVTQVKLHSVGASGTLSGSPDVGADKSSYRTQHRVYVSDPLDSPITIHQHFRQTASLPYPGRAFRFANGFDALSYCKTLDAQYVENSAGQYHVACTYESKGSEQNEQGQDPSGKPASDPTLWHDDIEVSYTQISVPVEDATFEGFEPPGVGNPFMKNGTKGPVKNSAMVPYDPPLEEELDIKVLRISRYIKSWDGALGNKFQGAVNSDNVVIVKPAYKFKESFKKYQGRIKSLGAVFQIVNGRACWRQSLELHVNPLPHGWRRVVVDRGLDRRAAPGDPDGAGGSISLGDTIDPGKPYNAKIKDEDGYPITEPVLLSGNGQPLKPGDDPVYLIYKTRKEMPFNGIKW